MVVYHDNILQEIPDLKFLPPTLTAFNNIGSKIFVHANNTIFDETTEGSTITVGYNTGSKIYRRKYSHAQVMKRAQ